MNFELELNENSERIDPLNDIDIILKNHQLSMIQRCIDIENNNICSFGVMSDKPGCGKTYAILGLIHATKKKCNIIVIPQNILNQWCDAIHNFSNSLLKYKKFLEYNDILELYDDKKVEELFDYDILITTSLYYNVISTTMNSNNLTVERVFFDEIDSISSFVINNINSKFSWFVSASFNYEELGIYTTKIDKDLIPFITCKCKDEFIDNNFKLDVPNIYRIICKNLYLDSIFNGLVSKEEYKLLNAMDYSRLIKKFCNKIAQNEKEAVDILVKDKLDIIEYEELRIADLIKAIEVCGDSERNNILNKQLDKSKKSYDESKTKLDLIRERLKENNCCPLCYNELNDFDKKVLSPCCKNIICFDCCDNWFIKMNKNNCIYCNKEDVKYEDYILIKEEHNNKCLVCEKDFECIDDKFYSGCCNKNSCFSCLSEWYNKLLKKKCLFCHKDEILIEDFKNEKQYEEMKLNIQSGIKYTKKTKIEFIEYFIKTKIYYDKSKVIICSNYVRIFNDLKLYLDKYYVKYIELDDVNTESIKKYTRGNINVLLLNSNLFGCGLNLECTTDILFLHKTEPTLEKQIIGRAQRYGRKDKLNIWYIIHENERIITTKKINYNIFQDNQYIPNNFDNLDNLANSENTIVEYNFKDDKNYSFYN